jgi:hypothetical protein
MDQHILEYYAQYSEKSPHGFHKVIPLHESPKTDWKLIERLVPKMSKGWYELARLPTLDRIEFLREYWLTKLPYCQGFSNFILAFFESLDDIGVFILQKKFDDPFEAQLVYSLKNNSGFFHGHLPATEQELIEIQKLFPEYLLPADYLAFLQIHNGFGKATDITGITSTSNLKELYEQFQHLLNSREALCTSRGKAVNPKSLIPFYTSFGMPFFQCFWADWYPEQEMGNVYYSKTTNTISDVEGETGVSTLAFPTFIDWLMFYLDKIE